MLDEANHKMRGKSHYLTVPFDRAAPCHGTGSGTEGTGTDNFSPNADCTRGQIVTFLYRAAQ